MFLGLGVSGFRVFVFSGAGFRVRGKGSGFRGLGF